MHVGEDQILQHPGAGGDVMCGQGGGTVEFNAVLLSHVVQSSHVTCASCRLTGSSFCSCFLPSLAAGNISWTIGLQWSYLSTPYQTEQFCRHSKLITIYRSNLIAYRTPSSSKYPSWRMFFPVNTKHGFKFKLSAATHSIVVTSSRLVPGLFMQFHWSFKKRYHMPSSFLPPPNCIPFSSMLYMFSGGMLFFFKKLPGKLKCQLTTAALKLLACTA